MPDPSNSSVEWKARMAVFCSCVKFAYALLCDAFNSTKIGFFSCKSRFLSADSSAQRRAERFFFGSLFCFAVVPVAARGVATRPELELGLSIAKLCWTSFRALNPPGSTNVRAVLIIVQSPCGLHFGSRAKHLARLSDAPIARFSKSCVEAASVFPFPLAPGPLPGCPEGGAACDGVANADHCGSTTCTWWITNIVHLDDLPHWEDSALSPGKSGTATVYGFKEFPCSRFLCLCLLPTATILRSMAAMKAIPLSYCWLMGFPAMGYHNPHVPESHPLAN